MSRRMHSQLRPALFCLLSIAMLLAGCDLGGTAITPTPLPPAATPTPAPALSAGATVTSQPGTDQSGQAGTTPTTLPPFVTSAATETGGVTQPVSQGASSADKIYGALQAGRIDTDTALVNLLAAAFDPGSLSAEYPGDDPNSWIDQTALLARGAGQLNSRSLPQQAQVAKYMRRPTDPESAWNKRLRDLGDLGGRARPTPPAGPGTAFRDTPT